MNGKCLSCPSKKVEKNITNRKIRSVNINESVICDKFKIRDKIRWTPSGIRKEIVGFGGMGLQSRVSLVEVTEQIFRVV